MKKVFAIAILAVAIVFAASIGEVHASNEFSVYDESMHTITSISWGSLAPGETKTITLYIENNIESPMTDIVAVIAGFEPAEAEHNFTLSVAHEAFPLTYQEKMPIQVSLAVSPSIVGVTTFSFNVSLDAMYGLLQPDPTITPSPSVSLSPGQTNVPTSTPRSGGGGGGISHFSVPSQSGQKPSSSPGFGNILIIIAVVVACYLLMNRKQRR